MTIFSIYTLNLGEFKLLQTVSFIYFLFYDVRDEALS